jgi:glycosyltransferase involved in cell wall biosynthesis
MTATLLEPRTSTTSAPSLSIVIASVNGLDMLGPTLDSIDRLPERDHIEVIVVEPIGGPIRDRLRERRKPVTIVPLAGKRPIPRLRYLGVQKARGDLIAILEDHAEVDEGWAAALIEAHRDPAVGAVGGAVENGKPGLVNWAVFFCEYTAYMAPVPEGPTDDLPGNNIAYKRDHLMDHAHVLDEGKWESWINDRLRAEGVPIVSTNRAVVRHIKTFRLGYFLGQRFHFARSYAGMRRVDQSWPKRLVYGAGSMALPGLLLSRVIRQALGKKKHLGRFAACLPLVALFLAIGAVGEMVGYLVGPGRSLERVE